MKKQRADEVLLKNQVVNDKKEAYALIMSRKVIIGDQLIEFPWVLVDPNASIRVKSKPLRGALKLEQAFEAFQGHANIKDAVCLDIGSSTGGFTQALLKAGAKKVIAVDVGTNQLAYSLRVHPGVIEVEKTHIRDFEPAKFPEFHIVVADISFNSLARLAPVIAEKCQSASDFYLLVKPQFELPRELIPKGGIVQDEQLLHQAISKVADAFSIFGIVKEACCLNINKGAKGNQEAFLWLRRSV